MLQIDEQQRATVLGSINRLQHNLQRNYARLQAF